MRACLAPARPRPVAARACLWTQCWRGMRPPSNGPSGSDSPRPAGDLGRPKWSPSAFSWQQVRPRPAANLCPVRHTSHLLGTGNAIRWIAPPCVARLSLKVVPLDVNETACCKFGGLGDMADAAVS